MQQFISFYFLVKKAQQELNWIILIITSIIKRYRPPYYNSHLPHTSMIYHNSKNTKIYIYFELMLHMFKLNETVLDIWNKTDHA